MIEIEPVDLHWLEGGEPESDLCAHGLVKLTVCGDEIDTDGKCCVSGAALYLLRTLESDHNESHRVAEHLLPCCGHDMHVANGGSDVEIIGCPNGFDWHVDHSDDSTISLTFDSERVYSVPLSDWVSSVCAFSDAVSKFYEVSAPKKPYDEYAAAGFQAFQSEWKRRRRNALNDR